MNRSCYACGDISSRSGWHANSILDNAKKIVLHWLCQSCYDHIIWYNIRYRKSKQQFENNEVEMISCQCGCGKQFPKYNQFGNEKKYYWASHAKRDFEKTMFRKKVLIQCRCGCGKYTRHYPERGTHLIYYMNGHYARSIRDERIKPINLHDYDNLTNQRHNVLRLYGYMKLNGCVVKDEICKNAKAVYLVPLDGDHYNIDIENYVVLCNSHRLIKNRRGFTSLAEILATKHTFYEDIKHKRKWYRDNKPPEIEMKKVLSQEQGDFRRT